MGVDVVGGTPNRLITKQNAVGQSLLTAAVTTVNGGTSSWVQVTASTATDLLVTGVGFYASSTASSPGILQLDIAYGGSGAEVALDSVVFTGTFPNAVVYPGAWQNLAIPQRIAVAQRVAVRATQVTTWGSGIGVQVYLSTAPTANLEAR